jgi:hypothetical protein
MQEYLRRVTKLLLKFLRKLCWFAEYVFHHASTELVICARIKVNTIDNTSLSDVLRKISRVAVV